MVEAISPSSRLRLSLLALCATVALAVVAWPSSAHAEAPIEEFEVTTTTTQAGGHPDLETYVHFGNRSTQQIPPPSCDCQDARDILTHLPKGVIGDPHATPQCSAVDFGNLNCPVDSQVGYVTVGLSGEKRDPAGGFLGELAVYNLVPRPGQAGLLAFNVSVLNFAIYIAIEPRTESDFGLDAEVVNITHVLPLSYVDLRLWGIPAAASHTPYRHPIGCDPAGVSEAPPCKPGVPSNSPERPFIDNPTSCGQALESSVEITAYDKETSTASDVYPATTGCDQLTFNPSLFAQPTTRSTDTASGIDVDLSAPQTESSGTPSPSEIRATTVVLPEGFSINPNAADGKTSCTNEEARIGTREAAQCPEFSKVGTLSLLTSALPGPLPGFVYLGQPLPGERYRLVLVADGFNVHVKILGTAEPDPETGQLTIVFNDLPEAPFSDFNMHFFGSERGLLATPTQCGTYAVTSSFVPWDAALPTQTSTQFFTLDSGPNGEACPGKPRPFEPGLEGGVTDNTGGRYAPFLLKLSRPDGDQNLSKLTVTTPPGLLASLRGIPYCSEASLAKAADLSSSGLAPPTCPAASQIGTSTTGAGAGSRPIYLGGKVYLAGPYDGAPLSLAVVTPAVSGPYDLGNVVVRVALRVDPTTAQITATSDPFPRILGGIPLRLRSVIVSLDRDHFMVNPTDCSHERMTSTIEGDEGATAAPGFSFQATDCSVLPFAPKLTLAMSGPKKRTGNPAFKATLTAPEGSSNIATTRVTLPPSELIDNSHIRRPCTRVEFAAHQCPASSVIGKAMAETPLLDQPLEGPVYLRTSSHGLPDIVAALNGQFEVDLVGRIDSVKGGLRTTFEEVPDAPVTKFVLDLQGGKRGLLENRQNLCRRLGKAKVEMTGQNGLETTTRRALNPNCGKGRRK